MSNFILKYFIQICRIYIKGKSIWKTRLLQFPKIYEYEESIKVLIVNLKSESTGPSGVE
jgi:hypothetical protein